MLVVHFKIKVPALFYSVEFKTSKKLKNIATAGRLNINES